MEKRETLIEQYDDAVFALLMDDYAEDAGTELLERYQAALDAGQIPEFPEELDLRCETAINDEFRARKKKARFRGILRGLVRLVFAVFIVIGLILRTVYEVWTERRNRKANAQPVPELHTAPEHEEEEPIFLTL